MATSPLVPSLRGRRCFRPLVYVAEARRWFESKVGGDSPKWGVRRPRYKDRAWIHWACSGHVSRRHGGKRVDRSAEERPARLYRRTYETRQ
jgi:hypothetical protein